MIFYFLLFTFIYNYGSILTFIISYIHNLLTITILMNVLKRFTSTMQFSITNSNNLKKSENNKKYMLVNWKRLKFLRKTPSI